MYLIDIDVLQEKYIFFGKYSRTKIILAVK